MSRRVAVIGGGAWGTALALHLARAGHPVRLWMREVELVARMRERRDNPVYLPGIELPEAIEPSHDFARVLCGAGLVVAAVPSPYARSTYQQSAPAWDDDPPVVVATKGIEEGSLALPARVVEEVLGRRRYAVLSGPCFARELASGAPTAAVVAAGDAELADRVQAELSGENLRLYTNQDLVGVQLAGALKNVIAIAAGIVDGLGLGHNTMAALITRGLAEMQRLGLAMGGLAGTFSGLAGLGDLVATCTGPLSRNRSVGQALARGERLEDIVSRSPSVAEGVRTARSARELAARVGVEMPIVFEMCRILYEDGSPRQAVSRLMSRPLTTETQPDAE